MLSGCFFSRFYRQGFCCFKGLNRGLWEIQVFTLIFLCV